MPMSKTESDKTDRIQSRAHEIWEREGRPHGRHDEHWFQAQAEVEAERRAAENLSAVAAGRAGQTGTTKTGGQISRGGAARGKSAKASRKDATSG